MNKENCALKLVDEIILQRTVTCSYSSEYYLLTFKYTNAAEILTETFKISITIDGFPFIDRHLHIIPLDGHTESRVLLSKYASKLSKFGMTY